MSTFRRGKIWWYEFQFRGHRIRQSTGSESKTLAVKAERQRRRELEESANSVRAMRRPAVFPIAAREWMAANQARWSESNVSIQEFNLKHLSAYFGSMLLVDVTPEHIGKYQGVRKKEGASNRTTNMEVGTLRMLLKAHKLWKSIEDDVRFLSEDKQIGKALTPDEETRLIEACGKSPQPSLLTAVVIFSNTGLRNAELRCARWSQIDFLKREFTVGKKAKTRASAGRVVPLNDAALDALTTWRARWPDAKAEDFIFPTEKLVYRGTGAVERGQMTSYAVDLAKPLGSWKTAWATAKEHAEVECRMHDLRHSLVSKLAELGSAPATIQAISGHTTEQMLALYTHISQKAKRDVLSQLDGTSTVH